MKMTDSPPKYRPTRFVLRVGNRIGVYLYSSDECI